MVEGAAHLDGTAQQSEKETETQILSIHWLGPKRVDATKRLLLSRLLVLY